MDYYTIIFLNPVNGNRFIIEGVNAQVEVKNDFSEHSTFTGKKVHFRPKKRPAYLDIVLEFNTTQEQYNKLKEQIISTELLLWFKDTHPNLIKGYVKGIIKDLLIDQHLTTITFRGNATDKTYMDYVTEVSNGLESEQHILTLPEYPTNDDIIPPDTLFNPFAAEPKPKKKRKDNVRELKRKLTFK